MSSPAPGSPEIRDYLLRRMPETARARFEEAYFRDDRLLDRIESEEDLLVADYVLGRLPEAEKRLFEESLLETPYYRDRVETTRSIKLRLAEERFFRKKAAAAGTPARPGPDSRLFPGGTGLAIAVGLLALVAVAALASAFVLKNALAAARRDLAERAPPSAPAIQAGVVPLAQTVVLTPDKGTGPALVRVRRPPGGALLLVFPQPSGPPRGAGFAVALTSGGRTVWDSGALPAKEAEAGELSVRLPPGVPTAGPYGVRLRATSSAGAVEDVFLGTLDVVDR